MIATSGKREPGKRHAPSRNLIALFVLLTGSGRGWTQSGYPDLQPPEVHSPKLKYIKMDVEAEQTSQGSNLGGQTHYERLYLAPAVGIDWDYYVYHPDLLNFSILAEPGYSWQESGLRGATTGQQDVLLNGSLKANLLQLKPYTTTFFAEATHNTHEYDFFNSVIEDAQTWGAASGYREGPVPITVSYRETRRTTDGLSYDTTSNQRTVNFDARNERGKWDTTGLSYQFNQYDSVSKDSNQQFHNSSSFHYVTLTDTEHFDKGTLNSTLLYDHSDSDELPSDDLSVLLNYAWEHTPHLRSFYDYSLSDYSTADGDSMQNAGRVGLQHQLYESLTTSADLHGALAKNSFNGTTLDFQRVGTSASVFYTKRLGAWGRLSLGNTANYDFTDQQSSGGVMLIAKEAHALPSGQWVRLNQPRIISIVSVTTDAAHGQLPLTENADYVVDRTRDPWQLQRDPFSLILSDSNNVVLVTYTVQPNPAGSYSIFSDQAQIRLDLWNGLLGVYARYSFTDNYTNTPGFVLEDVNEFQAGTDFTDRGLRVQGNYTDRHSTLFDYRAYSLMEGYSKAISSQSTIGVDFIQRWTYYPGDGTNNPSYKVTYYDFILRYDWHPVTTVNWSAEGGYERQRGNGFDLDLFVVRSYLNWLLGKLELHLGYQYQDQQYVSETRERHFVFLRARRNF